MRAGCELKTNIPHYESTEQRLYYHQHIEMYASDINEGKNIEKFRLSDGMLVFVLETSLVNSWFMTYIIVECVC